jgi:hypothetical protein
LLLARELAGFRATTQRGRTDADRAFCEGRNDDLVLAVGAALLAVHSSGPAIDAEAARELAGTSAETI